MKENLTLLKKETSSRKAVFFQLSLLLFSIFVLAGTNLNAQVCCPQFDLKDAVEICPPAGACVDSSAIGGQGDKGFAACKESAHVYTVYPNDPAYTYTWTVSGGTPSAFVGNPNVIVWGTGNVGYIKVVISNIAFGGDCLDSISAQICLIDGPEANFLVDQDTVCENTPVYFSNTSLGGSEYVWDFGDGTTSTLPNPGDHAYTSPGTYTVTLTATDMGAGRWIYLQEPPMELMIPCGCSDTITRTIVVLPGEGPKIETDCCYGTVCPGETSSFCSPPGCGTYNWTVNGGVISSGAGTDCITVSWDASYTVPTTVSLETPGCSTSPCDGITTVQVPVLYPNLPIVGPAVLCQAASGTFSLPTLPGTYYTWTVTGGGSQFNLQDRNTPTVNISFFDVATYTIQCDYDNPLAECSGSSTFTVSVQPEFSIYFGEETVCEGSTMQYYASGPANWSVSPAGASIIGTGAFVNIQWNVPGNYTITATPVSPANFCNTSAVKAVEVIALPILNPIAGADTVCPNENYTYNISSDTEDSPFTWAISAGTGTIQSEMGAYKDSVIVQFSSAGPWQLEVYQEVEIAPGISCPSLTETLDIYPFAPPSVVGPATVCVDAEETYTAGTSASQEGLEWSISPAGQGSILSGQGTNTVDIKWHGPSNTATLTVTSCTGTDSQTISITGPPDAVVTRDMLPVFCEGEAITLNLSTPNVGGYSYQWYKTGTPIGGATNYTYAVDVSLLAIGTFPFYVVVTDNGCTVKSNIVDVVIKNCEAGSPGGPPGPGTGCDVVAYFWAYVECNSVTLVDQSYTVGGASIASHTWSVSGPGTATFSPDAFDPNPTLTVSESGNYTITLSIISSTGCPSAYSYTVNILLPNASFTMSAPACENEPIMFIANPNDPDYSYEWDFGDGFTSYDAITEHAYDLASPPDYSVILIIRDEKGCVADSTATITVNPSPNCTITASDTIFCPGSFETLTACPGMGYQWYKDGNLISGANAISYDVYQPGEYFVEVTNSVGCASKSNEIYMYMNTLPVAKISGEGHICAYPSSTSGVYLTTVYDANYSYSWSSNPSGATFSPTNSASSWASISLPAILPASYELMVDVTDLTTGCINSDTICVSFFETPSVSVPMLNICEGNPVFLTPTPNDPAKYSYQWSNGASTPGIIASAPGYYSLTMTDKASGCVAYADAGMIFEKPDLSLFPLGCADICPPDSLHLYIPLPLNSTQWPNNTYPSAYPGITWYDNGDYTSPVAYGQSFDFPAAGTGNHEFSVIVQNNFGCVDTAGVFCLTDNDLCCEIIVDWQAVGDASCAQLADGSYSILLNPASVGGPFTISKTFPLPVQTWTITPGVVFTASGLLPGSYVFEITDASGECHEVYDVHIGSFQGDCCFAAIDSNFIHITAPITYTTDMVWDDKYFIADGVIVTVDGAMLDVTNVDVVFGECAGIDFIDGGYLRANNSVFRPCDIDKSWKGLYFNDPGEFDNIVNESTFKNAEVALYFNKASDAVVSNNLFSNCNYGIRVENNNDFNHPISGNRFVTEDFFPDFACATKYSFVNNNSTFGIYSRSSRFLDQVSHNEFINSKGTEWPRVYGVSQQSGGGVYSENTFTDLRIALTLWAQSFYTSIENNEIEVNLQTPDNNSGSIYIYACQGPVIEVVNNEITNNYHQWNSFSAVYARNSTNLSILSNQIDGFDYGIIDLNSTNHQISNNVINDSRYYGILVMEQPYSTGYFTCNSIKMRDYNFSQGFGGYNLSSMSEVSSNCITDCRTSMLFFKTGSAGNFPELPLIRNNFLYNYNYIGINVYNYSGDIGTVLSPGLNTLWSNDNSATDINSNSYITVADNFGMFNISFPQVQITSNNPYHSTASCGHQIFNMPSQGNLNVDYDCDNSARILNPMSGSAGAYYLSPDFEERLKSSLTPFEHASMIMASVVSPDLELLNEILGIANLNSNQSALLKYNFHYRNEEFQQARMNLEMYVPLTQDESNFKNLSLYDLTVNQNGWEALTAQDIHNLKMIVDEESEYSNQAILLLNNVSGYRDLVLEEPIFDEALRTGNIQRIEDEGTYLKIHPNPVRNTAYIELINNTDGDTKIEVFDISGKLLTEYTVSIVAGGIELNVTNLKNGIYFVTLTDNESGLIQKGKMVKVEN